jgi:glycosyltransferase involved in cell wall biosynthesis
MTEVRPFIHVVVTAWNCEEFIAQCIRSIRGQSYRDYACYVFDDASPDATYAQAVAAADGDARFSFTKAAERGWAARSRKIVLDGIVPRRSDDVVVLVDGDDWLLTADAFARVADTYARTQCECTHGTYISTEGQLCHWARAYPDEVRKEGSYRSYPWVATHLRSFRLRLWQSFDPEWLLDPDGNYYKYSTDVALFLPILELCGPRPRVEFIREPLYVYNRATRWNIDKVAPHGQAETVRLILQRPPCKPLG